MNGGRRTLFLVTAALLAGRVGLGCATQSDDGAPATTEPESDGGDDAAQVVLDASDAAIALDAATEADVGAQTCSADGWCYTTLPEAGTFDAGPGAGTSFSQTLFAMASVWTSADHQAWAVTAGGHVMRWDGSAWSVVTVLGTPLHAIVGTSATDLWIAGDGGLVLHGTIASGTLTLTKVPIGTSQSLLSIWGTSPANVWVLASDGAVFHLQPVDASDAGDPDDAGDGDDGGDAAAPPSFVQVNLPSDYPGDYDYFRATALWGYGNDVWIGGTDFTYCDPVDCQYASELVVRKWLGGNDGERSWDRVRVPMADDSPIALYSNLSLGVTTTDGVQLAVVNGGSSLDGRVVRIATNASQLSAGLDGVHQDGGYAWAVESTTNYRAPQAIWATSNKDVWLAGPAGVRHYDGTAWQIGRLTITPGVPLLSDLHALQGVAVPPNGLDLWAVGDDVALHRTVTP